jgi:dTDP-4-dehydrorhamnose 3,5-epimerase
VRFTPTPIDGVTIVDLEPILDERGFFARSFCAEEFKAAGLVPTTAQSNVSFNIHRGTVRGLHYQSAPAAEDKLIRCTAGAVFDVAVDLRESSTTYGKWFSIELTAENHRSLYIPAGCAHGVQALADGTELIYMMSTEYEASLARGVRWDDPSIGIAWPIAAPIVSSRDASLPFLNP